MICSNVGQTQSFILKRDRGTKDHPASPEDQTIFTLKAWPARVGAMVQDALLTMTEDGEARARTGTGMYVAVQYGIANIENMKDAAGNVVKPQFVKGNHGQKILHPETMDRLKAVIRELYVAINVFNSVEGSEEEPDEDKAAADATVQDEAGAEGKGGKALPNS